MEKARITWQVTHSDGRVEVWTELRDALESVGLSPEEFSDAWIGDPRPEAGAEVAMVMMRGDCYSVTVYTAQQLYRTICAMRDSKGSMRWGSMLIKLYTKLCDDITVAERDIRALEAAQDKALRDAENCSKAIEAKREYLLGLKTKERETWRLINSDAG